MTETKSVVSDGSTIEGLIQRWRYKAAINRKGLGDGAAADLEIGCQVWGLCREECANELEAALSSIRYQEKADAASEPEAVKCLDCGAMVPYGEPCPECGLGE